MPSSSQFYVVFHPDIDAGPEESLSTLMLTTWVSAPSPADMAVRGVNSTCIEKVLAEKPVRGEGAIPVSEKTEDAENLQTNQTTLLSNAVPFSKQEVNAWKVLLEMKRDIPEFDLSDNPVADELVRMAAESTKLENEIEDNAVKLDMQDKELEDIIANIAETCELRVAVSRELRDIRKKKGEVETEHKSIRVDYYTAKLDSTMFNAEKKEIQEEIDHLETEIDADIKFHEDRREKLERTIAGLKDEIHKEETNGKELEESLRRVKQRLMSRRVQTESKYADGEPCSAPAGVQVLEDPNSQGSDENNNALKPKTVSHKCFEVPQTLHKKPHKERRLTSTA